MHPHTGIIDLVNSGLFNVMSYNLSPEEVAIMRLMFDEMDTNGDGYISIKELRNAMLADQGFVDREELYEEMALMDKNGDGRISFIEFAKGFLRPGLIFDEED